MAQIDDVLQKIRNDIVAGELPFGSRVTIAQLSARYQVSHMPIREALRSLHGEGLLTMEPNKGARIRTVDSEFIANIFDMRCALEVMLVKKMVVNATQEQLATLTGIETELERCVESGDHAGALRANREFHSIIHVVARNPDAVDLLDRHWLLISALWRRYGYGPERFAIVVSDHRHLLQAFANRDPDDAAALMQAHVIKAKQSLLLHVANDAKMQTVERKRSKRRVEAGAAADTPASTID